MGIEIAFLYIGRNNTLCVSGKSPVDVKDTVRGIACKTVATTLVNGDKQPDVIGLLLRFE